MKENFNIENLVNQKLQNFEADVNPAVWAKVQAGIGAGAVVTTGLSTGLKIGLISGGIIAASVITYFAAFNGSDNQDLQTAEPKNITTNELTNTVNDNIQMDESIIVVDNNNDPVIIENKEKIEAELRQNNVNGSNNQPVNTSNNVVVQSNNTTNTNNTVNSNQNQVVNQNSNNTQVIENHQVDEKILQPTGKIEYTLSGGIPAVITLKANAQNAKEIKWDFGDGTYGNGEETKHTYQKPGNYRIKLTIVANKGLVYEESVEITIKTKSSIDNIPNVITPNGDRINDYFSIKSTEIENFSITIIDKSGNEVFFSNDKEFVWDATDKFGDMVEKGMYTYLIIAEGKDGSVIKVPGSLYVQ